MRKVFPRQSPGRTDWGANYHFYNHFTARFISPGEAIVVLRGMDRRLPAGYSTVWDFSEVDE